jgi:HD-GYP domain-containing protein (c-di-GMP phosphodiesterase class II)
MFVGVGAARVRDLFQQAKDAVIQLTDEFFADLSNEQLPESVSQTLEIIIKQLLADKEILCNLVEIRAESDAVFKHCINVSILSMIIGSYAGYSVNRLTELATGSILIDIGKMGISHKLLDDPSLLSVQENIELQQHTQLGFEKLKQLGGNFENAAQIVLQHHENYDGTGFPQGLKGNQIHEYARIVAIADTFNLHQTKGHGFDPSGLINDGSGTLFDPELTKLFSQKVAPLITSGVDGIDDSITSNKTFNVQEHEAENLLKSQNPNETRSKVKRPSKAEYKHDSISTHSDKKHSSLFGKMFGRFAKQAQIQDQIGEHPTLTPKLINRALEREKENISFNAKQNNRFIVNPERYQQTKTDALQIINKFIDKLNAELIPGSVIKATQITIGELIDDNNVVNNLVTIKALNDKTFSHCISVGLLSVMTGASLGYTPGQLKELGTGSLLVDVGKVEIARKYDVDSHSIGTTEYTALMPEHTQLGFEQLWKLRRNTNTPYIALQHHERFDGSGFPVGLKGQQINEFARIVALADAYDTLINEGVNGQKLMPHEVIEYIRDYSGSHFDPEISRIFLQNTTPFLIGASVLLNTGEKARVIKLNKNLLARPVIRVIFDKDGNKLATPIAKDLATDLTLFIVGALSDDEF